MILLKFNEKKKFKDGDLITLLKFAWFPVICSHYYSIPSQERRKKTYLLWLEHYEERIIFEEVSIQYDLDYGSVTIGTKLKKRILSRSSVRSRIL